MTEPLLAVEDLHAYYEQSHVVQGVSLHVNAGEIVGLIGRNGAGKTTTLKAIMGVVRARPGRVRLAGVDITQLPTHEIARAGLTLVPEDRRIFPSLTVAENLRVASLAVRGGNGAPRATLEQVFEYFPRSGSVWVTRASISAAASSRCSPSRAGCSRSRS